MAMVYEIFTKISLENKVSTALVAIGQEIFKLEGGIGRLTKAFEKMGTTAGLISGGVIAALGVGIGVGLKKLADGAKELSHELVQIQKLNPNPAQFEEAKAAAYALHSKVPAMTTTDALKLYGNIFTPLGHEAALKMLEPLGNFATAMGNQTGDYKKAADKVFEMVRAGHQLGEFMNEAHQFDPDKLLRWLDLGTKVMTATHGKVSADTWYQMVQQGAPAISQMSPEGKMTMAMLAQEMKGPRAGTAIMSTFSQFQGGIMTQWRAELLKKMGFVGDYEVLAGGHLKWAPGALDTPFTQAMRKDPLAAVTMLREGLKGQGYDTLEKQIPVLFQLFQRQTTIRAMGDILRNIEQMGPERERLKGAMGVSAGVTLAQNQDYTQVMHNFDTAIAELIQHVGGPITAAAIPVIRQLTGAIDTITAYAKEHPKEIQDLAKALMVLSAALVVVGGTIVVGAIASMATIPSVVTALAIAFTALVASNWGVISGWVRDFDAAITKLLKSGVDKVAGWFTSIGEALNSLGAAVEKFRAYLGISGNVSDIGWLHGRDPMGAGGGSPGGMSGRGEYTVAKAYALQKSVGASDEEARMLAAISQPESAGNPRALNPNGELSYGLWQINMKGAMGAQRRHQFGISSNEQLYNPAINARAALALHRAHGGYNDWSAYKSGFHRKYLSAHPQHTSMVEPYRRPSSGDDRPIHNVILLDGKQISKSTVKHVAGGMTHPVSAAYHDGARSWTPPDAGLVGV